MNELKKKQYRFVYPGAHGAEEIVQIFTNKGVFCVDGNLRVYYIKGSCVAFCPARIAGGKMVFLDQDEAFDVVYEQLSTYVGS